MPVGQEDSGVGRARSVAAAAAALGLQLEAQVAGAAAPEVEGQRGRGVRVAHLPARQLALQPVQERGAQAALPTRRIHQLQHARLAAAGARQPVGHAPPQRAAAPAHVREAAAVRVRTAPTRRQSPG